MTLRHFYITFILFVSTPGFAQPEVNTQTDQWDAQLKESGFDLPDDVEAIEKMNTPDQNDKRMVPTFDAPANDSSAQASGKLNRSNIYHPNPPSRDWGEHKKKLLESSNFDPPKPGQISTSPEEAASDLDEATLNAEQKELYQNHRQGRNIKLELSAKFNEAFPINCIYGCTGEGQSMHIGDVVALHGADINSTGKTWVTTSIYLNNPARSKSTLPTSQWPSGYLGSINITDYDTEEGAKDKLKRLKAQHNANNVDSITLRWMENLNNESTRNTIKHQPHMATALRSDQYIVTVRIGRRAKDEMPSEQFMQKHGIGIAELVTQKMFNNLAYNSDRERYEPAPAKTVTENEYPSSDDEDYLQSDIGLFYKGKNPTTYQFHKLPAGWIEHVSQTDGFSIAFPENWKVEHVKKESSFLKLSVRSYRAGQKFTEAVLDVNRVRLPEIPDASKLDYVANQEREIRDGFIVKTRSPIIINGAIADSMKFEFTHSDGKRAEAIGLVLDWNGYLYYVRTMMLQEHAERWRRELQRVLQSFKVRGVN